MLLSTCRFRQDGHHRNFNPLSDAIARNGNFIVQYIKSWTMFRIASKYSEQLSNETCVWCGGVFGHCTGAEIFPIGTCALCLMITRSSHIPPIVPQNVAICISNCAYKTNSLIQGKHNYVWNCTISSIIDVLWQSLTRDYVQARYHSITMKNPVMYGCLIICFLMID